MKRIIQLVLIFCISTGLSAQYVFVNEPAGLSGSLNFTNSYAVDPAWNIDLTSGVWTFDAVLVTDVDDLTTACVDVANVTEVNGNFALIDRGACTFTQKVCNAEAAGATGVIIMNHTAGAGPGPMGFTAGICDPMIPVVHISYEDGAALKAAIANGETVNISIGAVPIQYDLSITENSIANPEFGTVPNFLLESSPMSFLPEASVVNIGTEAGTNVTVATTIGNGGAPLYDESGTVISIPSGDTSLVSLSTPFVFDASHDMGVYDINYVLTLDDGDQATGDNELTSQVTITDKILCKSQWDAVENAPKSTTGYRSANGNDIEFLSAFRVQGQDQREVKSISYRTIAESGTTLGGIEISTYLYTWDDTSGDGNIQQDELATVGFGYHAFDASSTETAASVTSDITDFVTFDGPYVIESDDVVLIAGVRNQDPNQAIFFGFDESFDHTTRLGQLRDTSDVDLPYFFVRTWDANQLPDIENDGSFFTGIWAPVSVAVTFGDIVNNEEVAQLEADITLSPNPATTVLKVNLELTHTIDNVSYLVYNTAGQSIYESHRGNIMQETFELDVTDFPQGNYHFLVQTNEGRKAIPFSVTK